MKTIVLTGGGTAGHIYPLLAIKERLEKENYQFVYIGGNGMEKDIISKDMPFYQIPTVKLQRKLTFKNLLIPFKLIKSIKEAKKILQKIKPNLILSKGGFVAMPVVLAGAKLGIPIISHESDLSFGLANKIILKKCNLMCTTFEQTAKNKEKCLYTGQPIRKNILSGNKQNIYQLGNFDKNLPNLLVVGGSLGAQFINEKVWQNIERLNKKFNIVHIAGKQAKDKKHSGKNYLQIDYAKNMGDFLDFADIVLSRAGAGAINEFLALKKPMLLIPLSKKCSRGDQIENAKLFKSLNIADMIEEENYNDEILLSKLENISKQTEYFKNNMKKIQNFDACEKIIEQIKKLEIKK